MLGLKQKGASPITILFMICVFAFTLIVALKLVQHYLDFYSIKSVVAEEAANPETKNKTVDQIKRDIYNQLSLNNIRDFNLDEKAYFAGADGENVIGLNYEVREHMFANIDAILTFKFEAPVE